MRRSSLELSNFGSKVAKASSKRGAELREGQISVFGTLDSKFVKFKSGGFGILNPKLEGSKPV